MLEKNKPNMRDIDGDGYDQTRLQVVPHRVRQLKLGIVVDLLTLTTGGF